jgi:MFS family permease
MSARQAPLLHLERWSSRNIVGVAIVAMCAGFGQFGAVAALGDVARGFGRVVSGTTIADQAGLSGSTLGLGLAILRLASLAAMPLTAVADRFGRRRVVLWSCVAGLIATVAAALSPSFWWFVAIFAIGRPLLSTSTAVGQVIAAESTDAENRTKSVALVTAGFGLGSGLIALLHSAASGFFGFRGLFELGVVPLIALFWIRRLIVEPARFELAHATTSSRPALGSVHRRFRTRLLVISLISFAVAMTSGPATGFVYLDAQDITKLSSVAVSGMVVTAGVLGVVGLVLGQRAADRFGRRPSGIVAMTGVSLVSILTYSGGRVELFVGYVVAIFFASLLAPTAGAFVNELFPTEVRAHVAGWLVIASVIGAIVGLLVFGAIADAGSSLRTAATVTFLPSVAFSALFLLLPETKGLEPEVVPEPR